jgi:hypothetical protein
MLARELLERADGLAGTEAPTAETAEAEPVSPASEPLREAVVVPQPPPPTSADVEDLGVVAHPVQPGQDGRRIVRAEDLPPVPREVFEPRGSDAGGPDPLGPETGS